MITFQAEIRIHAPLDAVFAFVSEPLQFPRWYSAVTDVRSTAGTPGAVGATYAMSRDLPTGRAENELEIVAVEPLAAFAVRTNSGPTPFLYRYSFTSDGDATVVRLDGEIELPGPAFVMGRAIRRGMSDNLATLKQLLERG
jgi:uncharacterized protein YndB with AHSA1/START domain